MRKPNVTLLTLLMTLLVPAPRASACAPITVIPAQPTIDDSIKVSVRGRFTMMCWRDVSQDCRVLLPDTLAFGVDVVYCSIGPYCGCAAFPYSYRRTCNFALLPAGSYTATFTERHISPRDPIRTFTQSVQFTITAPTPTLKKTWGRLKLLYR